MIHAIRSSKANVTSDPLTGSATNVSRIRITVVDEASGGAWIGVITVKAQTLGMLQAGVTSFPSNLLITKMSDGSTIAAATGMTAAGVYEIDCAGLEVEFVHAWTQGTVSVYVQPVEG